MNLTEWEKRLILVLIWDWTKAQWNTLNETEQNKVCDLLEKLSD